MEFEEFSMAKIGAECKRILILTSLLLLAFVFVAAEEGLELVGEKIESGYLTRIISFLQRSRDMVFPHVWPVSEFSLRNCPYKALFFSNSSRIQGEITPFLENCSNRIWSLAGGLYWGQ